MKPSCGSCKTGCIISRCESCKEEIEILSMYSTVHSSRTGRFENCVRKSSGGKARPTAARTLRVNVSPVEKGFDDGSSF